MLRHPSLPILKFVLNKCDIAHSSLNNTTCVSCQLNKSYRLPFTSSIHNCTKPLEIVHSDLWGPAPLLSTKGFRNYVPF